MASFKINNTYISEYSTISSDNETVKTNLSIKNVFYGQRTTEAAESKFQMEVINEITKTTKADIILSSDLSNQLAISNKTLSNYNVSYLGVYNACSSFVEEIIIASSLLKMPKIKNILAVTSSHNLNAERTFRYPIEYGSPRRNSQTFTATGAVGALITNTQSNLKVESCTIGKSIDYGIKDVNNMGAVMAPAAFNTIKEHLKDFKRDISYYDLILTGDLGKVGSKLLKELLNANGFKNYQHKDAGSELIVDKELTDSGASGPACLPLVLFDRILKDKKYKKILIIGTGALHNTTLVNQKNSIPAIAHAVSLEVLK